MIQVQGWLCLSTRELDLAALDLGDSLGRTSHLVTRAGLRGSASGLRGAEKTRPSRPNLAHQVRGGDDRVRESRKPPWTRSISSSDPTGSQHPPPRGASLGPVAGGETRTAGARPLPVPCGRFTVPADNLGPPCEGSTPSLKATSTVPSNLVGEVFLGQGNRLGRACRSRSARRSFSSAFRYALTCAAIVLLLVSWRSWSAGQRLALPLSPPPGTPARHVIALHNAQPLHRNAPSTARSRR